MLLLVVGIVVGIAVGAFALIAAFVGVVSWGIATVLSPEDLEQEELKNDETQ
jgi:hypothetical protein